MIINKPLELPTTGGVYMFTFDTGHFYIGSTSGLNRRINSHIKSLSDGKRVNSNIRKIVESGFNSVNFVVLNEFENKQDRLEYEEKLIMAHEDNEYLLNQKKWVITKGLATKQISATLSESTIEVIKDIAKENDRTFSNMVAAILTTAAAHWIKNKSRKKSKNTKP